MKKQLLILFTILLAGLGINANGQGMVDVSIIATGDVVTDSLFVEDGEGNVIDTIVVSFALSSDDAEQENDEMDALYDDDLDAGWEGQEGDENILTMGLRFQNITIPQGATIDSAFIIVYSHEAKLEDDVANVTIYADDSDNAPTFTEDSLITDRQATTASVEWTVAEEWKLWEAYSTPDLKSVVQEIVDRSGWSSGNAIAFVLAGENQGVSDVENAREMESFENISDPEDEDENGTPGDGQNHPERAPRLIVYYNGYSTAVNESKNANNLSVYPSVVTNGQLVLTFEGAYAQKGQVFNSNGQMVMDLSSMSLQSGTPIDVTQLSAGLYLVQIQVNNHTETVRFIVK